MLQTENQDQQKPPIKTEPKIPGTYDPSNRLADNDRLQLQLQCAFAKPARQRERERDSELDEAMSECMIEFDMI